jgi:LemA protein
MRPRHLLSLLLLSVSVSACGYNKIQELDEKTSELKSNIGVELTNRNNLIPNLVKTVEGAAQFEKSTYTGVAQARAGLQQAQQQVAGAVQTGDPKQMAASEAALNRQIGTYLNVAVEAYPQLRAQQNFQGLQDQLTESENRIAVARRDYNEAVQQYNTYIRKFPAAITAKATGAERKEPYQAPAGSEAPPQVDFGTGN